MRSSDRSTAHPNSSGSRNRAVLHTAARHSLPHALTPGRRGAAPGCSGRRRARHPGLLPQSAPPRPQRAGTPLPQSCHPPVGNSQCGTTSDGCCEACFTCSSMHPTLWHHPFSATSGVAAHNLPWRTSPTPWSASVRICTVLSAPGRGGARNEKTSPHLLASCKQSQGTMLGFNHTRQQRTRVPSTPRTAARRQAASSGKGQAAEHAPGRQLDTSTAGRGAGPTAWRCAARPGPRSQRWRRGAHTCPEHSSWHCWPAQ